jgi:hypothetical protein
VNTDKIFSQINGGNKITENSLIESLLKILLNNYETSQNILREINSKLAEFTKYSKIEEQNNSNLGITSNLTTSFTNLIFPSHQNSSEEKRGTIKQN